MRTARQFFKNGMKVVFLRVLGAALVIGLIAAGFLLGSGNDVKQHSADATVVDYHWIAGTEQSYRLSIVSNVRLQLPGSELPQNLVQRLSGTLNMRVFDRDEGQIRIGFQLSPVSYTLNKWPDETLQQGLAAPFVVVFDQHGRPVSFQFPAELEKTERILLEESIRTFQVVFPGESRNFWTTAEEHATGRYLAHYRIRKDGGIEKKKTLYTEMNLPSGGYDTAEDSKAELRQSLALIRMSDLAWLSSVKILETLSISGGSGLVGETSIKAELESAPVTYGLETEALFGARDQDEMLLVFSAEMLELKKSHSSVEHRADADVLSDGEHLKGLVAALNVVEKSGRIPLLKEIERALKGNPELAFSLIEQIEGPGISGATDAWLIHLLERSGTPQSQEALVRVMDGPSYRDWNRIRAIVALGGVKNATDEAIASLRYISQNRADARVTDMANAALVAVGSIGKALGGNDPYRAAEIRGNLEANLQNAADSSESGMVLKAIENMGDPTLGAAITPYLQDDSSFVRSAAARALGRVRAEGSLEMLTDQMTHEKDRMVRSAIISGMEGLGNATPRSLGTVRGMVLTETEAGARYHMAKYLGDNLAAYPEARKTLQILALKDTSSRVRKYAATVLRKN